MGQMVRTELIIEAKFWVINLGREEDDREMERWFGDKSWIRNQSQVMEKLWLDPRCSWVAGD